MKVISFCLWGDDPKYNEGAIRNAELAARLYPDWTCKFYVPCPPNSPDYRYPPANDILCEFENVKVKLVPWQPDWKMMLARFKPACEDHVEVMISRDCDSRLSEREAAAVQEWLDSPKGFHIMRDHPYHGTQILGGMWGMKRGCLPEFEQLLKAWNAEDRWQTDQDFLKEKIYPRVVHDSMVHDEFFFLEQHAKWFPTDRKIDEFVGQVFDENEETPEEHLEPLRSVLKRRSNQ